MKYEKIITAFLDSEWGSMFTWENVAGNAFLTDNQQDQEIKIILETLRPRFSVCKGKDYSGVDLTKPFCFTGTTDEENSLVCPEALVPGNTIERDDGWKGFRIIGQLDFLLNRNSGAHIKDPGRGWDWHICHLDLFHLSVRSCRSSRIVQRSRADQNV